MLTTKLHNFHILLQMSTIFCLTYNRLLTTWIHVNNNGHKMTKVAIFYQPDKNVEFDMEWLSYACKQKLYILKSVIIEK